MRKKLSDAAIKTAIAEDAKEHLNPELAKALDGVYREGMKDMEQLSKRLQIIQAGSGEFEGIT